MSNPKIDWSDLENVEPVPGGDYEGWKVVGHYPSYLPRYPHLLVLKNFNGECRAESFTDDGRRYQNQPPVIRNKPKRVTLEEFWVVYTPDGQYRRTVFSEEAAEWNAGKGRIIRHIPAEVREV